MLDLNNLYWEEEQNIRLIEGTAKKTWGNNVEFGELKVLDSPYPEFELIMRLYKLFDIKLTYDRSTLSIGVPTEEGYLVLSRAAKEPVFRGFDGMKAENLSHNFEVLDRLIQTYNSN